MNRAKSPYILINICFTVIIVFIILYSLVNINNHPIPSLLTNKTGIIPPSKGLSRAFSMIVRGNINGAVALNQHSIKIFLFFATQLVIRLFAIIITKRNLIKRSLLITMDIITSIILFTICFWELITYTFNLLTNGLSG